MSQSPVPLDFDYDGFFRDALSKDPKQDTTELINRHFGSIGQQIFDAGVRMHENRLPGVVFPCDGAPLHELITFAQKMLCKLCVRFGDRTAQVDMMHFNLDGAKEAFELTDADGEFVFDITTGVLEYAQGAEQDEESPCPICHHVGDLKTFIVCSTCGIDLGHSPCLGYGEEVPNVDVIDCDDCKKKKFLVYQEQFQVNQFSRECLGMLVTETLVMAKIDYDEYLNRYGGCFWFQRGQEPEFKFQTKGNIVTFAVPSDWKSWQQILDSGQLSVVHTDEMLLYLESLSEVQGNHFKLRTTKENRQPIDFFHSAFFTATGEVRVLPCGFLFCEDGQGENCVRKISEHIGKSIQKKHANKIGKLHHESFTSILRLAGLFGEGSARSRTRAKRDDEIIDYKKGPRRGRHAKAKKENEKKDISPMPLKAGREEEPLGFTVNIGQGLGSLAEVASEEISKKKREREESSPMPLKRGKDVSEIAEEVFGDGLGLDLLPDEDVIQPVYDDFFARHFLEDMGLTEGQVERHLDDLVDYLGEEDGNRMKALQFCYKKKHSVFSDVLTDHERYHFVQNPDIFTHFRKFAKARLGISKPTDDCSFKCYVNEFMEKYKK